MEKNQNCFASIFKYNDIILNIDLYMNLFCIYNKNRPCMKHCESLYQIPLFCIIICLDDWNIACNEYSKTLEKLKF